jgi:hypothetical protein
MNAVGAYVGSNFNFTHDHRFFGQDAATPLGRHRLRHHRHLHRANTRLTRLTLYGLGALFENFLEHVHYFAGIGALKLDELAPTGWRHVHLVNHASCRMLSAFRVTRRLDFGKARMLIVPDPEICHRPVGSCGSVPSLNEAIGLPPKCRQVGSRWRPADFGLATMSSRSRPRTTKSVERHAHLDDLDCPIAAPLLAMKMFTLPCTKLSITSFCR